METVLRPHQAPLSQPTPVAPGRDDCQIAACIGQIRIDTGDIPVALRIVKGIAAGLRQIPKGKSSQIPHNVHHLHFAGHRPIYIQVYRLLDAVTAVMIPGMVAEQGIRGKHPRAGVKPQFVGIKGINLHVALPVQQAAVPVVLRLHIGSVKIDVPHIQALQAHFPGFPVIPGHIDTFRIQFLLAQGGADHQARHTLAGADASEAVIQITVGPQALRVRRDIRIAADPALPKLIAQHLASYGIPGITTVTQIHNIIPTARGAHGHKEILSVKSIPLGVGHIQAVSPEPFVHPAGVPRRACHQSPAVLRHPYKGHIILRHRKLFPILPPVPGPQQAVPGTGKIQGIAVLRVHHQPLPCASAAEIAMYHRRDLCVTESLTIVLRDGQLAHALAHHTAGNIQPLWISVIQGHSRRVTLIQILHGHMVNQTLPPLLLRLITINAPYIRSGVQYARRLLMVQQTGHIAASRNGSVVVFIGQLFRNLHGNPAFPPAAFAAGLHDTRYIHFPIC